MKKIKIKGEIINGEYNDLKVIDKETNTEMEDIKGLTISFKVHEMATVNIEYYADDIELDVTIIEDETKDIEGKNKERKSCQS